MVGLEEDDHADRRQTDRHDACAQRRDDPGSGEGFPRGEALRGRKERQEGSTLLLVIEEQPYQVQLELAKASWRRPRRPSRRPRRRRLTLVSQARLALDVAQLRLDQIEERRERNLLARKAASQEDYDKAEAQRKKSAAQVECRSGQPRARPKPTTRSTSRMRKAEVDRAKSSRSKTPSST